MVGINKQPNLYLGNHKLNNKPLLLEALINLVNNNHNLLLSLVKHNNHNKQVDYSRHRNSRQLFSEDNNKHKHKLVAFLVVPLHPEVEDFLEAPLEINQPNLKPEDYLLVYKRVTHNSLQVEDFSVSLNSNLVDFRLVSNHYNKHNQGKINYNLQVCFLVKDKTLIELVYLEPLL